MKQIAFCSTFCVFACLCACAFDNAESPHQRLAQLEEKVANLERRVQNCH